MYFFMCDRNNVKVNNVGFNRRKRIKRKNKLKTDCCLTACERFQEQFAFFFDVRLMGQMDEQFFFGLVM